MSVFELEKVNDPFGGYLSHPGLGLGLEGEQIERVAKAQVMKYLPEMTEKLQKYWDLKDEEYSKVTGIPNKYVKLPTVEKENFYTGVKPSLVNAPIAQWPSITVYSHNSKPDATFQPDQYDLNDVQLCIEILCKAGPIEKENLHKKEGIELEQILNSQLHRISDAVWLCIKKDATIGGVIHGEIEKPPTVTTSLPWSRVESSVGGAWYIFQGRLHEYTVQRNTY